MVGGDIGAVVDIGDSSKDRGLHRSRAPADAGQLRMGRRGGQRREQQQEPGHRAPGPTCADAPMARGSLTGLPEGAGRGAACGGVRCDRNRRGGWQRNRRDRASHRDRAPSSVLPKASEASSTRQKNPGNHGGDPRFARRTRNGRPAGASGAGRDAFPSTPFPSRRSTRRAATRAGFRSHHSGFSRFVCPCAEAPHPRPVRGGTMSRVRTRRLRRLRPDLPRANGRTPLARPHCQLVPIAFRDGQPIDEIRIPFDYNFLR